MIHGYETYDVNAEYNASLYLQNKDLQQVQNTQQKMNPSKWERKAYFYMIYFIMVAVWVSSLEPVASNSFRTDDEDLTKPDGAD